MNKRLATTAAAVLALGGLIATAVAAPQPTDDQLRRMERAYRTYAFPAQAQPVAEYGMYACIAVDIGGAEAIACGESLTDPGLGGAAIPWSECDDQGGTVCTYPWDTRKYCCGIQLGAPPVIDNT